MRVGKVWLWSLEETEKKKRKMKSVFERMRRKVRESERIQK